MVSVTGTQNATAQRMQQQAAAQAHAEKLHAMVAAVMEKVEARAAAASVGPTGANDLANRISAQLDSVFMKNGGGNIWTRASGFTASFASRPATSAPASTSNPSFGVKSTDNAGKGGELIVSNKGDKINGGAGNDTIVAGAGSVIHGGDGNDDIRSAGELYGDKGNDRIEGGGTLYGGEGDDTITLTYRASTQAYSGAAMAYGGAGNDKIIVHRGNVFTGYGDATVEGGKGDDLIQVSGNPATRAAGEVTTVRFNVGDGRDYIEAMHGDVVLELGEGFAAENMKISYSKYGEKAVITFNGNEDDQLTLSSSDFRDEAASTFTIKFSDGSTHELEELKSMHETIAAMRDAMTDRYSAIVDEYSE